MTITSPGRAAIAAIALTGLLALGACATTPSGLQGDFTAVTPQQVQDEQYMGDTVRWGGLLVDTTPGKTETCFRVVGLRLDRDGEPLKAVPASADGRFLACAKGFYDPEFFVRGRRITFVGTVTRIQHEKVGGYDYPYPRLEASAMHLWPREPVRTHTRVFYMDGWWSPYGAWGWWPWGAPPPYYRYPDPDDGHGHRHGHGHKHPLPHPHPHPLPPRQKPRPPWHELPRPPIRPQAPHQTPSQPPQPPAHPARPERPASPSPPRSAHRSTPRHPHKPPR